MTSAVTVRLRQSSEESKNNYARSQALKRKGAPCDNVDGVGDVGDVGDDDARCEPSGGLQLERIGSRLAERATRLGGGAPKARVLP